MSSDKDMQLSDRGVILVFFSIGALTVWATIGVAHNLYTSLNIPGIVFALIILTCLIFGIQTVKHFKRPHLSFLGLPLLSVGWGAVLSAGSIIPFIGIASVSIVIYAVASTVSLVILIVKPRIVVNIWSGIGVLIFSTLLSVVIVYNFAPSAGVDFTIGENSLAGFWALYLEALFLLATREALVSKDRSLEVIIDKGGSLLLDQATLALRKVNFKFTGDNPAPPTLMFGKAEGSFAFNIKLGGWVFVTQFSRHKVISNGQES